MCSSLDLKFNKSGEGALVNVKSETLSKVALLEVITEWLYMAVGNLGEGWKKIPKQLLKN